MKGAEMASCRGIRGAITVGQNTPEAIIDATQRLLQVIVTSNHLRVEDIASATFTATSDLDAVYPARAAREMGWVNTPLMCMQEMHVSGSLARCIRVLIHWNTDRPIEDIRHIYLDGARVLRRDWVEERG
jgi:chorismate mutase